MSRIGAGWALFFIFSVMLTFGEAFYKGSEYNNETKSISVEIVRKEFIEGYKRRYDKYYIVGVDKNGAEFARSVSEEKYILCTPGDNWVFYETVKRGLYLYSAWLSGIAILVPLLYGFSVYIIYGLYKDLTKKRSKADE